MQDELLKFAEEVQKIVVGMGDDEGEFDTQLGLLDFVVLYSIVLCSHLRLRIYNELCVTCVHTCEFHVNPLSWMQSHKDVS